MIFSDVTTFSNVCLEYVCLPHLRSTSGHRKIITDCHIGMWNLGIWHTGIPNTARLAVGIPGTSRDPVDAVLRTRREDNCKDCTGSSPDAVPPLVPHRDRTEGIHKEGTPNYASTSVSTH